MNQTEVEKDFPDNNRITIVHFSRPAENSDSSPPEKNSTQKDKKINSSVTQVEKNKESSDFSSIVAAHYNAVGEYNFEQRNYSRIVYLRNFNNWIKSILIRDSVWQLPEQSRRNLKVLDMCCGKGGDLFKWSKLNVRYMICVDIAENSLEQYKSRYKEHVECVQKSRKHSTFECEFIPADCTKVRLRGRYVDPSIRFDIVSCQFSFHYCFESLPQAECMLKNATECLKPGGLFIGTIPNANEIVKRVKQSKTNSFKNDLFAVEMCCTEPYPLFGAKYNFYLEGVVNCPEFLVHFPTFKKLAAKYGLELVRRENFTDYFERRRKARDGELLLKIIKALETYPPDKDKKLAGPSGDYIHAKVFYEENNVQQVGTLSMSEWEVISLYQSFVFKKVEVT